MKFGKTGKHGNGPCAELYEKKGIRHQVPVKEFEGSMKWRGVVPGAITFFGLCGQGPPGNGRQAWLIIRRLAQGFGSPLPFWGIFASSHEWRTIMLLKLYSTQGTTAVAGYARPVTEHAISVGSVCKQWEPRRKNNSASTLSSTLASTTNTAATGARTATLDGH